jgi:hypothetical protein
LTGDIHSFRDATASETARPCRLVVRTEPSHGSNSGSNPGRVTCISPFTVKTRGSWVRAARTIAAGGVIWGGSASEELESIVTRTSAA